MGIKIQLGGVNHDMVRCGCGALFLIPERMCPDKVNDIPVKFPEINNSDYHDPFCHTEDEKYFFVINVTMLKQPKEATFRQLGSYHIILPTEEVK